MNTALSSTGAGRAGRAFTLVELVVVIILISVLAALVVPRLGGMGARAAQNEAEEAAALISVAVQRAAAGSEICALSWEPAPGRLSLLTRPRGSSGSGGAWSPAPLARPAVLSRLKMQQAMINGSLYPGNVAWRCEMGGASGTPSMGLLLVSDESVWQVDLPPESLQARARALTSPAAWQPGLGDGIDLDATGRRNKAW